MIFLSGEVEDRMANLIVGTATLLESEDPKKDINIYINSPGGSGDCRIWQFTIPCNLLNRMCVTLCIGPKLAQWAHSTCGWYSRKTCCVPNAVMIPQPLGGFRGQASDIQIHAQEILKLNKP